MILKYHKELTLAKRAVFAFSLFFLCYVNSLYTQNIIITGTVKDSSGIVLSNVIVSLEDNTGLILAYDITSNSGVYQMTIAEKDLKESHVLVAKQMGKKSSKLSFRRDRNIYDFILENNSTELKEVVIKAKASINRYGDTLAYDIVDFERKEDRSIGDVLRHMPGFSVTSDGTIYFNGNKINNLIIDGDDLMDGRYTSLTDALPKILIRQVHVVSNHQPIKILRGKTFTDGITVNLITKEELSTKHSFNVTAGIGLPALVESKVNHFSFNKKIKNANTIAINNVGSSYLNYFDLASSSQDQTAFTTSPTQYINPMSGDKPDLPLKEYYRNKSGEIYLNHLNNITSEVQLKVNIFTVYEKYRQNINRASIIQLEQDTLSINNDEHVNMINKQINGSLSLIVNKDKYYLNENIIASFTNVNGTMAVKNNNLAYSQKYLEDVKYIYNEFRYLPRIVGLNHLENKLSLYYGKLNQILSCDTGIFSQILNNGQPYNSLSQTVTAPGMAGEVGTKLTIVSDLFQHSYAVGSIIQSNYLKSQLRLEDFDNYSYLYQGDDGNDSKFKNIQFYFSPDIFYKKKDVLVSLKLPISFQKISIYDQHYVYDDVKGKFLFNPEFLFNKNISVNQRMNFSLSYKMNQGTLSQVYKGLILTDYRNLQSNELNLQNNSTLNTSLNYSIQNHVNMIFTNMGLSFNRNKLNSIESSSLSEDLNQKQVLQYENITDSYLWQFSINKYFYSIKSNISLKNNIVHTKYNQILNHTLFNAASTNYGLTGSIEKSIHSKFMVNYLFSTIFTVINSKESATKSFNYHGTSNRSDHKLTVIANYFNGLTSKLSFQTISNNQMQLKTRYPKFVNISLSYNWKKQGIFFDIECNNLLNTKEYSLIYLSNNYFIASSNELRGINVLAKITKNFL